MKRRINLFKILVLALLISNLIATINLLTQQAIIKSDMKQLITQFVTKEAELSGLKVIELEPIGG